MANTVEHNVDTSKPDESRVYTMLENNPRTMTSLAHALGLSPGMTFTDVYSFDEDLLSYLPRPCFALLCTIPLSDAWKEARQREDDNLQPDDNYVLWFKQTAPGACGLLGLLHCLSNVRGVLDGHGLLIRLLLRCGSIPMASRGRHMTDSDELLNLNEQYAFQGDSTRIPRNHGRTGNHFVAFVKKDGHLWELEGSRKGPLDRGELAEDEDVLSQRALDLGIRRIINLQGENEASLRFSCIALTKAPV